MKSGRCGQSISHHRHHYVTGHLRSFHEQSIKKYLLIPKITTKKNYLKTFSPNKSNEYNRWTDFIASINLLNQIVRAA